MDYDISHGECFQPGTSLSRQGRALSQRYLLLHKAVSKDSKPHKTHRWQAGVPSGCVITAATYTDIAVVNLGCTQAMGWPSVL